MPSSPHARTFRLAPLLAAPLLLLAGCALTGDDAPSWAGATGVSTAPSSEASSFDAAADRPPEAGTLFAMAHICAAQGRDAECETLLTKILASNPECLPAYTELAALYLRHDLPDSAITVLERGLQEAPGDAVLRNDLGLCRLLLRDYQAALEEFSRAAAAPPLNARYRANMAVALGLLGRDAEALALWQQILPGHEAQANLAVIRQARATPVTPG